MTTPIHVLCSNFTEIVRRNAGETMRCFRDKEVRKMRFSAPFHAGLPEGTKSLHGSVPRDPTSPCKILVPIDCYLRELFPKI